MMYDLHGIYLVSMAFGKGIGIGKINIPIEHLSLHLLP